MEEAGGTAADGGRENDSDNSELALRVKIELNSQPPCLFLLHC